MTTPWTGFETRTQTSSDTVVVETPACSPGMQWAYYKREEGTGDGQIPFHSQEDAQTYPFDLFNIQRSINGQDPNLTGETDTWGITNDGEGDNQVIYGTDTNNNREWVIVQHLGYFRPNQAGDYVFGPEDVDNLMRPVDDTLYLWFDDEATSTYDNNNAALLADIFYEGEGNPYPTFTYSVSEDQVGSYIPIRFLYLNAQGRLMFNLAARNPQGEVIVGRNTPSEDGQFVNSCDPEVAPALEF